MQLSIISPCYNESKNIKKFIKKVFQIFPKKKIELIIVDDDSNDGTDKIIKKLSKKYKNLKFFSRKDKPRDLSCSCFLGIKKTTYNKILIMDSDLQHDPKDIIKLYNKFVKTNADIVVGSRNLLEINKGLSLFRQIASLLIIKIFNFFLGKKTSDPMSGFFIFKKKIYNRNNDYFSKGFKILADLIYSSKKKLIVKDENINFKIRKGNSSKMSIKILILIILFIIKKVFRLPLVR